jgi:hypothetical protein
MSGTTSVTIAAILRTGYVDLSFSVVHPPANSTITRLVTITNDNSAALVGDSAATIAKRAMIETSHSIVDSLGQPVTKVVLNSNIVPAGVSVFVTLLVYFNDANNTVAASNTISVISKDIPIAPADNNSIFREDDQGLSINIGKIYTSVLGPADGYSYITKAIVYISKVGGTAESDFITRVINLTMVNGVPVYDSLIQVANNLTNNQQYEVAFRVVNGLGQSALSKTYILMPRDFPATLEAPDVYTLLGNQARIGGQNALLSDTSGNVVVYFNRPSDANTDAPVTRYVVTETYKVSGVDTFNTYTIQMDPSNNFISPSMSTSSAILNSTAVINGVLNGTTALTPSALFTAALTNVNDNTFDDSTFISTRPYKLTIFGVSEARLGREYTYTVSAVNKNGSSPPSPTDSVITFLLPSPLTASNISLNHVDISGSTINGGESFRVYNGKMTMRIGTLSSLNSGLEYFDGSSNNINFKLTVSPVSINAVPVSNTAAIYIGYVTFIRSGTTGNFAYNLDFDNVTKVFGTGNETETKTLNQLLVKGTKYKFSVSRLSKNPNSQLVIEATAFDIYRTVFSSPGRIKACESYAYLDDANFTPVQTPLGQSAIRILFNPLSASELLENGLTPDLIGTTTTAIRYLVYQDSAPLYVVPGTLPGTGEKAPPLSTYATIAVPNPPPTDKTNAVPRGLSILSLGHFNDSGVVSTEPYVFTVPTGSYGNPNANYLRIELYNRELETIVNAQESSPAVTERSVAPVAAPQSITISNTSATSITVSFPLQTDSALYGNGYLLNGVFTTNVKNRIILLDASNNLVASELKPYVPPTLEVPDASHTFSLLTTGNLYRVYIIAEAYYTRREYTSLDANNIPTDTIKRFNNIVIRNSSSYISKDLQVYGIPSAPTNVEVFTSSFEVDGQPKNEFTAYYDAPLVTNGVRDLKYRIYAGVASRSIPDGATGHIAEVSGTSQISITDAYDVSGNKTSLQRQTTYNVFMKVAGNVGGLSIARSSFIHSYTEGLILNAQRLPVAANSQLSLTPPVPVVVTDPTVPLLEILGTASASITASPDTTMSTPTDLRINADEGVLTVSFDKQQVNDLIVSIDYNDTLDASGQPLAQFDTRGARDANNSGLWNLENNPELRNGLLYGKYDFAVIPAVGLLGPRYTVTFENLTNGVDYRISVRYCNIVGSFDVFSPEATKTGSPEAAPGVVGIPSNSFDVDSNTINLRWLSPLITGSSSATLNYRLSITEMNGENSGRVTPVDYLPTIAAGTLTAPVSPATQSTIRYTNTMLTNGIDYLITVLAFYVKTQEDGSSIEFTGTPVNINSSGTGYIRPRPKPVGATMTARDIGSNSIGVTINPPSPLERQNYPLTSQGGLQLFVRHKAAPTNSMLINTWTNSEYAGGSSNTLFYTVTTFPGSLGEHDRPLNGFEYEFFLDYVENYTDAQTIAPSVLSVTPRGPISIVSSVIDQNKVSLVVNRNGSGNPTNIIGLIKSGESFTLQTFSSTSSNIPASTNSNLSFQNGIGGRYIAAQQLYEFSITYSGVTSITDHLTVVSNGTTSDTAVNTNTFFS